MTRKGRWAQLIDALHQEIDDYKHSLITQEHELANQDNAIDQLNAVIANLKLDLKEKDRIIAAMEVHEGVLRNDIEGYRARLSKDGVMFQRNLPEIKVERPIGGTICPRNPSNGSTRPTKKSSMMTSRCSRTR